MALCQRCYKVPPVYDCLMCKGYYCLSCDKYIHSFPSKKTHTRRMIDITETMITSQNQNTSQKFKSNNFNEQELDINNNSIIKETIPIYDSNIGKNSEKFDCQDLKYELGPYIDIEENYLRGTNNIANKIEELSSNISTTKINLNERIDSLQEHIHKADEAQNDDIININSRNLREINNITTEKDAEIKHLQAIIEKQKEKINELKNMNNNLETTLDNCIKIKDRCLEEKNEIFSEKKELDNYYIKDLDEMQFAQEEERKKIVNEYEDKFNQTNSDYHEVKDKLLNELKNMQMSYDHMREEHENNMANLNMKKNRLEQDNRKKELENEELIKDGENMKENLRKTKTQMEEMEEEMNKFDLDNLQLAKEMESMSNKSKQMKRANTALGKSVFRASYRPDS